MAVTKGSFSITRRSQYVATGGFMRFICAQRGTESWQP